MIVGNPGGCTFNLIHQAFKVAARGRNRDHSNRRLIPQSGRFHFGYGNIETGAQPVF